MEKDKDRVSHWFALEPNQFIQDLLSQWDDELSIYVVTIEPETNSNHSRMPRVVGN